MKHAKKLISAVLAFLTVGFSGYAQEYLEDPRYGNTPEERQENVILLQFFKTAYETNAYDEAINYLYQLLERAPRASENTFIRGLNLYKQKVNSASSVAEKNMYVDSVMYLYDLRAEYFGDDGGEKGRAGILADKAHAYLGYRPMDRENVIRLYREAADASEGKDPVIVDTYFSYLVDDYKEDLVPTADLLSEYERLSNLLAEHPSEENTEGIQILENLLISSGAADCANLEKLFKPQYEADPENVDLMKRILGRMSRQNCGSDFQLEVAENLYKHEPIPETSVMLAAVFEGKGDYEKSLYYWEEAIKAENDPDEKISYILRAAGSALGTNNYRQVAAFARQAIAIQPNNGLGHFILAQAYLQNIGCSDFERQTAYWVIVDMLQKARSLLPADSDQVAVINRQISQYSAGFPSDEELFFRSLTPGNSYTVNCGMVSGTTTIRAR